MLQILYISTVRADMMPDLDVNAILVPSRRNNKLAGVTGLLFYDGKRFLQVLEGREGAVQTTFERIRADARHRGLVVLSRRAIEVREFGEWSMACHRPDEDQQALLDRVTALAVNASPSVKATFDGFANVRRAA